MALPVQTKGFLQLSSIMAMLLPMCKGHLFTGRDLHKPETLMTHNYAVIGYIVKCAQDGCKGTCNTC